MPDKGASIGIVVSDQWLSRPSNVIITLTLNCLFQSHKTVSHRKQNAFSRWHASWVRQNVTDESHQSIDSWFMGKTEDLCPNRTQRIVRNFMDRTPYRTYKKYHVEMVKSS